MLGTRDYRLCLFPVSGQTLEVEIRELSQGVKVRMNLHNLPTVKVAVVPSSFFQDIRKDLRELARLERVPGDRFEDVMTVSLH